MLGPSLLFVASFSAIFIVLGLTATGLGSFFQEHKETLTKVSAALIIAHGRALRRLAVHHPPQPRVAHKRPARARGKGGPIVAGAAFAIAWTPCIGPTLGAILAAASISGSAARGAFLLAVYSAGLAIPFLLTAVAFSQMTSAFAAVKRHYQLIVAIGGLILIAMGILIWTDELTASTAKPRTGSRASASTSSNRSTFAGAAGRWSPARGRPPRPPRGPRRRGRVSRRS